MCVGGGGNKRHVREGGTGTKDAWEWTPTKKSQPNCLRDCEDPVISPHRKRRTNQCVCFCCNCWDSSPRPSYSFMESRLMAPVSLTGWCLPGTMPISGCLPLPMPQKQHIATACTQRAAWHERNQMQKGIYVMIPYL